MPVVRKDDPCWYFRALCRRMRKTRKETRILGCVFLLMVSFHFFQSESSISSSASIVPVLEKKSSICGLGRIRLVQKTLQRVSVSSDDSSQSSCARPLQLIHIPKTGGSTLEIIAATHNVTWGACHFLGKVKHRQCPRHVHRDLHHPYWGAANWHVPVAYLDYNVSIHNPYIDADLFAVVRHPFSRLVSEWNFRLSRRRTTPQTPDDMNHYLQQRLTRIKDAAPATRDYFVGDGHYIPQSDFLVGFDTGIHILRQEQLMHDFQCLLHHCGLEWTIPKQFRVNAARGTLSVEDLNQDTKQLARQVYARDFEWFGYSTD